MRTKSHTTLKHAVLSIAHLKARSLLCLLAFIVGLWPTLLQAKTPPKPCKKPVCYSCKTHAIVKLRISQSIGCRKKLRKRDKSLAKIKGDVKLWLVKDKASQALVNDLTKQRDVARAQREKAARELRKTWTIFWSVTGTIVVASAVVIVAMAVTRPPDPKMNMP